MVKQSFSLSEFENSQEKSCWEMMQDSTLTLATQCEQLDPNGITVYLFAEKIQLRLYYLRKS